MADEPKTVTIWDGAITYERPEYDAETKTLLAAIATSLAKFGRHKDALLAILRDGHERGLKSAPVDADGTKSTPFDADRAWRLHLEGLARQYFHREWVRQEVTKPADRQARSRTRWKGAANRNQTFSERASPSAVRSLYGSSSVSNIVLHLRQQFLNNKSSRPIPNRPFEKGRQCECALEDLYGLRIFVLFIEKVAIEVICIQPVRSIRDCFLEIPSGFGLFAEA
jgi:hypothetical protein